MHFFGYATTSQEKRIYTSQAGQGLTYLMRLKHINTLHKLSIIKCKHQGCDT